MDKFLLPLDDGLPSRPSGEWAKRKLFYVKHYIDTFEKSMRNMRWRRRNYIDLFAGPGKGFIRNTQEHFLGSPLIAITTEHPFTDYYFVDAIQDNIKALKIRSGSAGMGNRVRCILGDAQKTVHDITTEILNIDNVYIQNSWPSLNLAFLDPEGIKDLKWETVEELARMKRMDLIIHYSQQGIKRMAGRCFDAKKETIMDQFFGDTGWREIYAQNKDLSTGIHRPLIDYYKNKIKKLGYVDVKDDEEIWAEPLMRNTKEAPLYRLLFASKHPLGVKFWKAVTKIDSQGQLQMW